MHDELNAKVQNSRILLTEDIVPPTSKSKVISRLFVVFILGFSSGLPFCLIGSTLQAWFASNGQSIALTASLSLLSIPAMLRFLWSPLLDRFSISKLGKRRTWIICTQLFLIIGLYYLSYLSPQVYALPMMVIGFLLAILSATQDAAIEAQRIEYLSETYYSLGASLSSTGYRLGILFSGGYALVMADNYGFGVTYRYIALFLIIGILVTLFSEEPHHKPILQPSFVKNYKQALLSFFAIPNIFLLLGFVFFYKLGEVFTSGISGIVTPFLIDGMKFSLSLIGYVNKVLGTIALITGGIFAGFIALRYSLSSLLLVFGLLQALTNAIFVILAWVGPSIFWFATAVISDNLATGMGSTMIVALLMKVVDKDFTATQFSMLVAFSTLPRILSGPIGAFLQHHLGWTGMYVVSVLLALCFIPFWFRLRTDYDD